MKTTTALATILLALVAAPSHAVTFDWATVGNPGNGPDQLVRLGNPNNLRFGSVDYTYRISKHEVTNDQYTEFLNAVDPTGANLNSFYTRVYYSNMESPADSGIAFDSGAASGSKYATKTNMGNKPVNNVSFIACMRFVNWLENGQPTGGSGTESGVYTIGDGSSETRAPGATFFIPSEDEWYKAAYHQPAAQGGDVDDYWRYPTASNSAPTSARANSVGDISNPGRNVANINDRGRRANWNGQNGNVTTVGSAGPLSASFYGTFDQGGNVWEWNEARGLRGGGFDFQRGHLTAALRSNGGDLVLMYGSRHIGFRVASIPEPSTGLLGVLGMLGLLQQRRL